MQIISCCTVLFILLLDVLCTGNTDNRDEALPANSTPKVTGSGSCALTSPNFTYPDKPVMHVPLLSEGEKANLTCSAPFPCPETPPNITWWISTRERNITDLKDNITLTSSKNLSTLTLTLTSDLHNATVECNVNYGNKIISANCTLKVMYKPVMHVPLLSEGEKANLTCSAPFLCLETPPEITWWIRTRERNITDLKQNITLTSSKNLSTLTLTPTSDLHNATVGCNARYGNKIISANGTLKVMYLRILGNGRVREGDTLNLSCTVENPQSTSSSSDPEWSFSGTNGTTDRIMNQTSAFLTINNVTKKNAGVYICKSTYENKNLSASITINVIAYTDGSSSSGRENGAGIGDFFMNWDTSKILTFVAGMACSALIFSMVWCCWVSCHRSKKQKIPTANTDTDVNLEMVQTDVAQTGTNEETPLYGQANGGSPNTAGPTDGAEEEGAVGMDVKDVDYASIDYSLLKDRAPEEEEKEPTDTDYAEIKRDKKGNRNEEEVLPDGDDQAETNDQIEEEDLELELKS